MFGKRWRTPCSEYELLFEKVAWKRIETESVRAQARETGGILIGYYTADERTAVVTEVSGAPRDSQQGRNWFRRGIAGLRNLLVRRWRKQPRTYYIGEWHYHPAFQVEPSTEDINQMRLISEAENYQCRQPIMVIVGRDSGGGIRPARAFVFPRAQPHLEFQPVGDEK